jgi:hypothetical protein
MPMKRILVYITLLSIVLLLVTTAITGCASEKSRGLAVYLTRDDIEPERLQDIDLVALSDSPIIAAEDIVSYNAQTYEIKLSREAFERICNLEVPTSGKSFVVCVDDEQIYRGAFWTAISSQAYAGITIMQPLVRQRTLYYSTKCGLSVFRLLRRGRFQERFQNTGIPEKVRQADRKIDGR